MCNEPIRKWEDGFGIEDWTTVIRFDQFVNQCMKIVPLNTFQTRTMNC